MGLPIGLVALSFLASFCTQALVVGAPRNTSSADLPAYPVKVSANGRYLVDQNNRPFLIAGDSPQGLMYRLTEAQAERYFALLHAPLEVDDSTHAETAV